MFDSGLGGLSIAQAIIERLPQYDYLYLGDTKRVPYGGRSQETIHEFVSEALSYLFSSGCELIILACNTASAESLRKSQQEYLPANFPERRVLGVIIPTAEAVSALGEVPKVGVMATASAIESGAFERELARNCPRSMVVPRATPLLVPLIEHDGLKYIGPVLDDYLEALQDVDAVILGCTHYSLIKQEVRARVSCPVISQDEVVPEKLANYLFRHPEIESRLSRSGDRRYEVTDLTSGAQAWANRLTQEPIRLDRVMIS